MKLILIAYANAAIIVPALWIGAPLATTHSRTPAPGLVSAQIISFPGTMRSLKPNARARPDWETKEQRLTRREQRRLQKADHYVAERRRSLAKED